MLDSAKLGPRLMGRQLQWLLAMAASERFVLTLSTEPEQEEQVLQGSKQLHSALGMLD